MPMVRVSNGGTLELQITTPQANTYTTGSHVETFVLAKDTTYNLTATAIAVGRYAFTSDQSSPAYIRLVVDGVTQQTLSRATAGSATFNPITITAGTHTIGYTFEATKWGGSYQSDRTVGVTAIQKFD